MNCNTNGLIFNQFLMPQSECTKKNRFKTRTMVALCWSKDQSNLEPWIQQVCWL